MLNGINRRGSKSPRIQRTLETATTVLGLNKVCEIQDFANPELAAIMRQIYPAQAASDPAWPRGHEYRKEWEVSMAVLAMQRQLPAERRLMALGVGAGIEATSFFLTHHFRFVFATDLYARFTEWVDTARLDMLFQPEVYAGSTPFQRRRLVVQNMDARRIEHEDATFDFIYSSSSIEHFGSREEIRQAAGEMGRVLKPGGIMAISTEIGLASKTGWVSGNTLIFSPTEVWEDIIMPSGCDPVDEPSFRVSEATLASPLEWTEKLKEGPQPDGKWGWPQYPVLVLKKDKFLWTSYHLTLKKP